MTRPLRSSLIAFLFTGLLILSACDPASTPTAPNSSTSPFDNASGLGIGQPDVAITAAGDHEEGDLRFELSTHEVASGWTTLQFENQTHADHFFLLYRVPQEALDAADAAGQSILRHWYENITVPFQNAWSPYANGTYDYPTFLNNLIAAVGTQAPWFFDPGAPPVGGPGLLAPGRVSATTVHLEPGLYVAECYVKDEDEVFHSYGSQTDIGMLELLRVTDEASGDRPPKPTMHVHLRNPENGGMEIDNNIRPGVHTVKVHFDEQTVYSHLLGHNAQLVALDDADDQALLDELGAWMDWSQLGSLVHGSPVGSSFMGGAMESTPGTVQYVHVRLAPGDYAWIAEIPDPAAKGMLRTFSVPGQQ